MGSFENFVNSNLGLRKTLIWDNTTPNLSTKSAGVRGSQFLDTTTNFLYEKTGINNIEDWVKIGKLGDSRGKPGGSNGSIQFNLENEQLTGSPYFAYHTGINLISGVSGHFDNLYANDLYVTGTSYVTELRDYTVDGTISGYTGIFQDLIINGTSVGVGGADSNALYNLSGESLATFAFHAYKISSLEEEVTDLKSNTSLETVYENLIEVSGTSLANAIALSDDVSLTTESLDGLSGILHTVVPFMGMDTAPPEEPKAGDLWWPTEGGSLKIYYDDGDSKQWVDASASSGGGGGGGSSIPPAKFSAKSFYIPTVGPQTASIADGGVLQESTNSTTIDLENSIIVTDKYTKTSIQFNCNLFINDSNPSNDCIITIQRKINNTAWVDISQGTIPKTVNSSTSIDSGQTFNFTAVDTHGASTGDRLTYRLLNNSSGFGLTGYNLVQVFPYGGNTLTVQECGYTTSGYVTLTLIDSTGGDETIFPTGPYVAGETVTITPNSDVDYVFSHWEITTSLGIDITSNVLAGDVLTLPSQNIFVEAKYGTAWTPIEITSDIWFDPSDSLTVTESSNSVTNLSDKSGNNYHLSSPVGKNPSYLTSTINGLNVLTYSDTSVLEISPSNFSLDPEIYVAFVGKVNATNISCHLFDSHSDQTNPPQSFLARVFGSTNQQMQIETRNVPESDGAGSESFAVTGNFGNNPFIVTIAHAGDILDGSFARVDGGSFEENFTLGVEGFHGLTLGNWVNHTLGFRGDIGEVLILNSIPDTTTQHKIEGYLAHKWGLIAKLPVTHPYKTSGPVSL